MRVPGGSALASVQDTALKEAGSGAIELKYHYHQKNGDGKQEDGKKKT
jgi:hypothetical protein